MGEAGLECHAEYLFCFIIFTEPGLMGFILVFLSTLEEAPTKQQLSFLSNSNNGATCMEVKYWQGKKGSMKIFEKNPTLVI